MSDDFIIEEEEQASGNRPFLIAAGALLTVFILAAACTGILLINRDGGENPATAEAIAVRETENAVILATNAAVTETVAAMETEEAQPTETPQPTATNTPEPTETAAPTNTPVVAGEGDTAESGVEGADDAEAEATANVSGTSVFDEEADAEDGEGSGADGAEGAAGEDGDGEDGSESTPTPIPAEGTAEEDALPETGINTWGAIVAAMALIGVLMMARRLRTA